MSGSLPPGMGGGALLGSLAGLSAFELGLFRDNWSVLGTGFVVLFLSLVIMMFMIRRMPVWVAGIVGFTPLVVLISEYGEEGIGALAGVPLGAGWLLVGLALLRGARTPLQT